MEIEDFDDWLLAVDKLLIQFCGLASADLPDQLYAEWYGNGLTPEEATTMVIDNIH